VNVLFELSVVDFEVVELSIWRSTMRSIDDSSRPNSSERCCRHDREE